jgi:hypothetical protein
MCRHPTTISRAESTINPEFKDESGTKTWEKREEETEEKRNRKTVYKKGSKVHFLCGTVLPLLQENNLIANRDLNRYVLYKIVTSGFNTA